MVFTVEGKQGGTEGEEGTDLRPFEGVWGEEGDLGGSKLVDDEVGQQVGHHPHSIIKGYFHV